MDIHCYLIKWCNHGDGDLGNSCTFFVIVVIDELILPPPPQAHGAHQRSVAQGPLPAVTSPSL